MDANIIEDILAFSDPFTESKTKSASGKIRIEMARNARTLVFEIDQNGRIVAKHRARSYANVESLLVSDEFANLTRFAETQLRSVRQEVSVPPIRVQIRFNAKTFDISDLPSRLVQVPGVVHLVLIDGPAGIGKTYQLAQLAISEAKRCLVGQDAVPILHVSSRGRRLSNLQDVLAASTQDLGAAFGARHVPILVRRKLLTVAVDGFDELVDADGYEYSWSALKEFLAEIGGGGVVLLAARDTFVEEQELLRRIDASSNTVSLSMGHILPIDASDAKSWLAQCPGWKQSDIESEASTEIFSEGSYALRPFFIRELRNIKGWSEVIADGPRTFLVSQFLKREAKLISKQLGGIAWEAVISPLTQLFQEVAQEMCERETDSIEKDHLAFLTDYCFGHILSPDSLRKLMHKAGSFALLELGQTKSKRRFPHSEIQYHFLAGALLTSLSAGTIPLFLRRASLNAEQLDAFSEVFYSREREYKIGVGHLMTALNLDRVADSFATNGGAIVLLGFALGMMERVDYLTVLDATLAGGSPVGDVSECALGRLDACGADISAVNFCATTVATLVVDERTRVGKAIPTTEALELRTGAVARMIRDPEEIGAALRVITVAPKSEPQLFSNASRLLDKIARRALRHFYLRENGDEDEGGWLLRDRHWPSVKAVLERFNRLDIVKGKQMHGRSSALIRIRNPKQLLDYNNEETKLIILALNSPTPSLE